MPILYFTYFVINLILNWNEEANSAEKINDDLLSEKLNIFDNTEIESAISEINLIREKIDTNRFLKDTIIIIMCLVLFSTQSAILNYQRNFTLAESIDFKSVLIVILLVLGTIVFAICIGSSIADSNKMNSFKKYLFILNNFNSLSKNDVKDCKS